MIIRLIALLLCLPCFCAGQNFAYLINDFEGEPERGYSLQIDDNNFYLLNRSGFYKFDSSGNSQWKNIYPEYLLRPQYLLKNDSIRFIIGSATSRDQRLNNLYVDPNDGEIINIDYTHIEIDPEVWASGAVFHNNLYPWGIIDLGDYYLTGGTYKRDGSLYSWSTFAISDKLQDTFKFVGGGSSRPPKVGPDGRLYTYSFYNNNSPDYSWSHSFYRRDIGSNTSELIKTYINAEYDYEASYDVLPHSQILVIAGGYDGQIFLEATNYDLETLWNFQLSIDTSNEITDVKINEYSNGDIAFMICTNATVYFFRVSQFGEILWSKKYEPLFDGESIPIASVSFELTEEDDIICTGSSNDDMIVFSIDSDGCYSSQDCEKILFEKLSTGVVLSYQPSSLEVMCDHNSDYIDLINIWLSKGGDIDYVSTFYDAITTYSWEENYEAGTYEVTFSIEVSSENIFETYIMELQILPSNEPPQIVEPPQVLTIDEADPSLEESIQSWLDNLGFGNVKYNCGVIDTINNYDYDYSPGNHFVTFILLGDNGLQTEIGGQISIQACTGQWTGEASELIVECDQDEEYKEEIENWISSRANMQLASDCDSIVYTNDWNGSYDSGNYWVTFTASGVMSSLEYSRGGFMSIQRGDSAPVITTEASDLLVVSNTLDIDLIIQQWLNSQGGAEAIDNCGSITWSHTYNLDLTPGEQVVMFKATSDNGVASETSATLTIELASSSEDIIEQNALSIYPNPSNGEFSIILEEDNHLRSKIEVFNPLGEIIFFTTLDQDIKIHQLNLSHIDSGIYVVKLSNLLGENSSMLVKY